MTEKYGVRQISTKVATVLAKQECPQCGATLLPKGKVWWCPKCGTEPLEGSFEEDPEEPRG